MFQRGGGPRTGKTKAGHAFWGRVRDDFDAITKRCFGRTGDPASGGATWEDVSERSVTLGVGGHADWRDALGGGSTEQQQRAAAEFLRLLRTHGVSCERVDGSRFVLRRGS